MSGNQLTPRGFLAKEIRAAREAKGMTPASLAKAIFVSESLIRAWERGRRIPKPDVLERLEDQLGTQGWLKKTIDDLVNTAVPLEWFGKWVEIEARALFLWSFQPLLVPGLLQTPEYARCVLEAAFALGDIDEMLNSRLERHAVLLKDDAPTFIVLMDPSVLERAVGDAKVMHDQMLHLTEMVKRRNVMVNFIPLDSSACAGFLSGFVIANFDGGSDVAYVDNQLNGEVVENMEDVARLRNMFETFRTAAMTDEDSIRLIQRAAERWIP